MSKTTLTNAALQDRMDAMQRELDEARRLVVEIKTILQRYVAAYPALGVEDREHLVALETETMTIIARAKR